MMDLETLAAAIRQLSDVDRKKLDQLIDIPQDTSDMSPEIDPPRINEDVETRIHALNEAFAEIRAGLSSEELHELVEAMNEETFNDDPELFTDEDRGE